MKIDLNCEPYKGLKDGKSFRCNCKHANRNYIRDFKLLQLHFKRMEEDREEALKRNKKYQKKLKAKKQA